MFFLESVFAWLRQVCFFEKEVTLSDQKQGNLNFALAGSSDMQPGLAKARLSLDNQAGHPHSGDH